MKRVISLTLVAVLFISCAAPVSIRRLKAPVPSTVSASGRSFPTEREARHNPEAALSEDLEIAATAWADLARHRSNANAIRAYNYSVERIVSLLSPLQKSGRLPRTGAMTIRKGVSAHKLSITSDIKAFPDPQAWHFTPADEFAISGKDYPRAANRSGVGAPVLWELRRLKKKEARGQLLLSEPDKNYYSLTAVLEFNGSEARLAMKDPLASDRVSIGGRSYPLAADLAIGPAEVLAKDLPLRLGLLRMIFPGPSEPQIVRVQPYDQKKIPVLMIHGLQDTMLTWAPLLNKLRSDPLINRRYQFWVYDYPSGYPFPVCAEWLRIELDWVKKNIYPDYKKIILIGHSMGGLIARLMITDSNGEIQNAYSGKPVSIDRGALNFRHLPEIRRVIFISTPHGGSAFASNLIGRIGKSLIRLPDIVIKDTKDTLIRLPSIVINSPASVTGFVREAGEHPVGQLNKLLDPLKRLLLPTTTSIDTLSPKDPFLKAVKHAPIADDIPYNSIIGSRDRYVNYSSSHLCGAQETIVTSADHMANQNEEGMEAVHKILRDSLRDPGSPHRWNRHSEDHF